MKLLTAIFLVMATTANAGGICEALGEFAGTVMDARQRGVSMSKVMSVANTDILKAIVTGAYSQPRMLSDTYKADAVNEYRIAIEVSCYEAIGDTDI